MNGEREQLWRKSLGETGLRVYLYERTPGGNLYREVWVGGQRAAAKKCLRHKNRERAEADGYELLAKLKSRKEALQEGRLTLSVLFDKYVGSPAHGAKKPKTQREDEALLQCVLGFLGEDREIGSISDSEIERFKQARVRGEWGPSGQSVGARAVAKHLVALRTMLNWATRQRTARGEQLLRWNPLSGYRIPVEKNPRRPVETYDRYLELMKVAGEVDWRLPLALTLAESTGQRIGSILALRRSDIDLDRLPHGRVRFRAESQKTGYEHGVPVPLYTRSVLKAHLARLDGKATPWLFPAERNADKSVCVSIMSRRLRKAYEKAELETLERGLWHPWRRKWATERKGMPLKDVAAAGGWRDTTTLLKSYQQVDDETVVRVVLEAPKLYGEGAERGQNRLPKSLPTGPKGKAAGAGKA